MDPLIVTLAIDPAVQARFDAERARLFPPGRTVIGAHVTLFHALPGDEVDAIRAQLREVCRRPSFDVLIDAPVPLGRGVAYRVVSTELDDVHGAIGRRWRDRLTEQDTQGFRPHVTVQNKVEPGVARDTLAALTEGFAPLSVPAVGLDLWRYVGGPWQPVERFRFDAA